MHCSRYFLIACAIIFLSCAHFEKLQKQEDHRLAEYELMTQFPFEVVYASYARDSVTSRFDVHIRLRYKDFVFEQNTNGGYVARYELGFDFYIPSSHEHVLSSWDDNLVLYAETHQETRRHDMVVELVRSFNIKPGRYKMRVTVTDKNIPHDVSYQSRVITKDVYIRDYHHFGVAISDILLVEKIESFKNGRAMIIAPSFGRSERKDSLLTFYFEIYNLIPDSLGTKLFYTIFNADNVVLKDSMYFNFSRPIISQVLTIPMRDMPNGTYRLHLHGIQKKLGILGHVFAEYYFGFYYWLSSELAIRNLDEAVEQLQYIVPEKQLKKIREAKGEEKENLFWAYWKKIDPSPNTSDNELMEEYYSRISYTNKNFGYMKRPGWKTDRGMVWVVLGPPDDIARRKYIENAYSSVSLEIWQYWNVKNRELVFVFVDKFGFGDYYLTKPFDPFHPFYY